ncbi:hypothetical protein BDQ94DRAFT_37167 [Aspergillus welwitschiae]|uniref:Uncharacterized protein n=1 Tax=Aspergillus welwitschiae TaxID=1341132 RepID=A0A3F3Q1M7_9EURO|nr:hypothetical protein BDQ94DRAFT_37167 [Aspergillus welwitschiae]RDH33060.1 hypothetical protein BDQ94DRAFT_37167 [Aspergillus welwitschiae]
MVQSLSRSILAPTTSSSHPPALHVESPHLQTNGHTSLLVFFLPFLSFLFLEFRVSLFFSLRSVLPYFSFLHVQLTVNTVCLSVVSALRPTDELPHPAILTKTSPSVSSPPAFGVLLYVNQVMPLCPRFANLTVTLGW